MRISYLIKKSATFKMLFLCLTLLLSVVFTNQSYAQLTGVKTIPGTYATVAAAVTDLNAQGVGAGGVTFDIAAGYTETLSATLSITTTGTLANPIVFEKSGVGANPLITAYTGGTSIPGNQASALDGIIRLVGSDWVTFDGISLRENPANSGTAYMEYGLAFYKVSGTNGCNNNTIKNCVITLNRNNINNNSSISFTETEPGSTGIFAANAVFGNPNVALTVTALAGANSNNKFYSNTIQNCNAGIVMRGFADLIAPFIYYDQSNDIGGSSPATANTIINYGGGIPNVVPIIASGIKVANVNAANISNNIVSSTGGTGAHIGEVKGILNASPNGALATFNNNTVSVRSGTFNGFITDIALDCAVGSIPSNATVNLTNNIITNCIMDSGLNIGNNSPMNGIRVASSLPSFVNITGNTVNADTMFNVGTFTSILYQGTNINAVVNITNNQVYNIYKVNGNPNTFGGNLLVGIQLSPGVLNVSNNQIHDMTIVNVNTGLNCTMNGISFPNIGTSSSASFTNNQIYNFNMSGNSALTSPLINGIVFGGNTGTSLVNLAISGNTFSNLNLNFPTAGAGGIIRVIEVTGAFNINVFNNKIYDITINGNTANIVGMRLLAGINMNIYNNYLGGLNAPTSTAVSAPEQVIGISDESSTSTGGQNRNIYYNTIYLSGTSSNTNFGSTAIKTNITPNTTLRNNIFINNTTPKGLGLAVAHRRASTPLTTYMSASNNNIFYSGTPSSARLIYYDNTNSDQTLAAYKARVAGRDNASATELTPFLSTVGSSPSFLHVNTAIATAAESGAANISGYTTDFDNDIRQGNIGYIGTGTAPDIGADEFGGIVSDLTPPAIAAGTVLGACGTGDRTISGVIITDASGVPTSGALRPRIYYKKNVGGAYFSQPGTLTSGTGSNGTWDFTIVAADMGGLTSTDSVGFYFIAQDVVGTPNISSVPFGALATDVNTVSSNPTVINYYKVLKSLSGTYLVGTGQVSPNYATIEAAVADYNVACLSGPVVFSLVNASYAPATLPIVINANPYASATNTLTIKPATGDVSIAGTSATHIFALLGADYIIFEGSASPVTNSVCPLVQSTRNLKITNSNTLTTQNAVLFIASNGLDGATNNIIRNCIIVGNSNTTTGAGIGFGAGPVATGFGTGTGSFGYNNSNNIIENDSIIKAQHGIVSQGGGGASTFNFLIKNQNNIYRLNSITGTGVNAIGRVGILLGYENNDLITGNRIANITASFSGADAIAISAGSTNNIGITTVGNAELTNSVISNNVIDNIQTFATVANQSAVGISMASSPTSFTSTGTNLIANNMISRVSANSNGTSDLTCGIYIGNQVGSTTQIYNNTVNMNADGFATNSTPTLALYSLGSGVIPVLDIKNNILTNTTRFGIGNNFVIGLQVQGVTGNYANLQSDNNDLFMSAGGGFYNAIGVVGFSTLFSINPGQMNFPTLASWQAETGREANSKNVLPVFVSTSNPHLVNNNPANVSLNGTAMVLAAVPTDIDCESRTGASSPDIGADEFTLPPIDIAFDAIKPSVNGTCHSASEDIIVTVRNTGSTTIDMSTDPIAVSCTYSGTISGTSTATVSTGTLAANATVDVTLTPTINTTVNGSYTFTTTITPIAGESSTTNNNNVTSIVINNTPVTVTTSVFNDTLCLGYSTPITATATLGTLPYSYSWSHALGSSNNVTVTPTALTIYTVTVTDGCGITATATAFVNVFTPGVQSVAPNSRCGVGAVALSAVPNPGSSLLWYNSPSSATIAATGNSYTPSVSSTTTFYVSARTNPDTVPYYVGLTNLSPANGAASFPNASTAKGLCITANKAGAITGCTVYPSFIAATDVIRICLRLRGSAVNIVTTGPFTFSSGTVGTPVKLNFNLPITTPGDYSITYEPVSPSTTAQVGLAEFGFSYLGSYPLSTADGSLLIVGGQFGNNLAPVASSYSSFFNVEYTTYCESARVPVLATVNTPPSLTIPANVNLCLNDTFPISVSSTLGDYDTYVWTPATNLYTNSACTVGYVPGSSATTVYVIGTSIGSTVYTCTATNNTSLCSNVATSTVTTQPVLTSLSASSFGICGSGSVVLSMIPATGFGVGGFVWESSTDSATWVPTGLTTTTITTPVLFSKTYYRVRVLNSNNVACSQLGLNPINVYSSFINSVTGGSTCGLGSVNLSVNVSAGATGAWYDSPTSVVPLALGLTYPTAPISTTTTYYVASREGAATYATGIPTATANFGTLGTSTVNTLWITVVKPGTIQTVTMYPQSAGTFAITLNSRGSAIPILTSATFTITSGQIGTAVNIPLNMVINTPGVYQLCFTGLSWTYLQSYNGSSSGYPFTNADGSLIIVGTANNNITVAALGSNYAPFFNIQYSTACESARLPVVATVNPILPFTINTAAVNACGGNTTMLNVTSTNANYDIYTWAPTAGLYTDAAGTIPYTLNANEDTVYANPLATTIYTATATNTATNCVGTQNVTVTPIYFLPSLATTANTVQVCGTGSVIVSVSGIFNDNSATYQWESSIDSLNWSPVPSGTSPTLLTPVLTMSTYFRCQVLCSGASIGNSPALLINVNNPLVVSTVADTVCGSGTPTLQATASPANATINWYDAPTGGSLIGSGNSFTTPVITSTTNFYAEASTGNYTEPVGIATPSSGGVNLFPGRGLQFNATKQLTINSVTVNIIDQGASAFIDIALQDNAGNEITSTGVVSGLVFGTNVVPLNFSVPVGTGYRLVVKNGTGGVFFSSSNPVTYPMNSFSGAMSLTSGLSSAGVFTTNVYYLFYAVNITAACYSPRVAVEAFVKSTPPVNITASATTVCAGTPINFSATSAYPFYSYTWFPDNINGANVTITPTQSQIYTVVATDISGGPNNGCQAISKLAISLIPAIPSYTVTPLNYALCKGSSVNINVNLPVLGGNAVLGTSTVTANQPTNYPAPYGELYESAKHQILILASELSSQGMAAGSEIKSLAFDVQSVAGAGIMNGFSIQIASTSANTLSSWKTTGFSSVFGPVNYQPVVGSNVHTFSSSFVWDGVSNIIVQTCFSNDPSGTINAGTANAVMNRTPTVFNSVIYANFNDLDVCGLTPAFVASVNRPNMVLGFDRTVSYSWSPAAGLNNSTSAAVIASPNVSTIYTVTITNTLFGCSASSTSSINVNDVVKPYLSFADTAVCDNVPGPLFIVVKDSGAYSGGYPPNTTFNFVGVTSPFNTIDSVDVTGASVFYTCIVTLPAANGGCSGTTGTTYVDWGSTQSPQLAIEQDSVNCNGGSTGSAIVNIAFGGSPNYRYQWFDVTSNAILRDTISSATADTLNNLPIGSYGVMVTDHQGAPTSPYCEVLAYVNVEEPAVLLATENGGNHTDIVCYGDASGSLGVDATGGTLPYSYLWSNGYTVSNTQTGLTAGTYTVTVTDFHGCSSVVVMTITTNPLMTPSITGNGYTCNGSTTLSTGVYSGYLWSNGATTQSTTVYTIGTYTVTVTNTFGCTKTATKVITFSSAIPAKPTGFTGSLIANCGKLNMPYTCSPVAGATLYTWTVPAGVKIISGQGTTAIVVNYTPAYTGNNGVISVTASNICGSSAALKRYTSARLTNPVIVGSNAMCPGDIKTYTVAAVPGALSYTWTKVTGSTILSGQGTTSVTIKWGAVGGVIKCTANNACGASIADHFGVALVCAKTAGSAFDFSELSLYPNPASTSATLQFNGFDNGKGLLQVFDIVGQLVITQNLKVTSGQNQYQLDLATLPKGIYSIRVVYNGMTRNEKLIVQ